MFIDKIIVHKNKALDVCGIKTITIELKKPILIIIGDNGSGKTTIIGEGHPLPATQTDYLKGYKCLHITHDNKKFVTESNFKKGIHHSFLMDNEELNISHTSTTQKDLCESHLQLTPFIYNVINMIYRITKMTAMDRRNLFFNAYPFMNVILGKHKKISSLIKSHQSNLKMLQSRKSELLTELMDKKDLKELSDRYGKAKSQLSVIEKILYSLEIENKSVVSDITTLKRDINYKELTIEDVLNRCRVYNRLVSTANREIDRKKLSSDNVSDMSTEVNTKLSILDLQFKNLESTMTSLKGDIDTFQSYINVNVEEEKETLSVSITNAENTINKLIINPSVPVLSKGEIDELSNSGILSIEEKLVFIKSLNGKIYTNKIISLIQDKISQLRNQISNNNFHIESYTKQLKECDSEVFLLPPKVCDYECEIKTQSLTRYDFICKKQKDLKEEISSLEKQNIKFNRILEKLIKLIYVTNESKSFIIQIESMLMRYGVGDYILKNRSLIEVLNLNPFEIINSLNKIISNSRYIIIRDENLRIIETSKTKLDILTKVPAKQLIDKSLLEKQAELSRLLAVYNKISTDINEVSLLRDQLSSLKGTMENLSTLKNQWDVYSRYSILKITLDWNCSFIRDLQKTKNELTDSLIHMENVIQKQNNISVRLDEEVNPNIKKIKAILDKYLLIESALSPSNGFPKLYMIRFINNIIEDVNYYISSILNADIKIQTIDEDSSSVNYMFPIKINGVLIPDINKCSKAQSNIIDICWNLSLYKQLGLNKAYPLIMDEPDDGFSEGNRTRLLMLLSAMVDNKNIHQLILISHFASMLSGFENSDVVCLSEENIVLPMVYNNTCTIN